MRDDLERSELRTSKLIDEADDHYLSMDQQTERRMSVVERKWAKKINSLQQGHKRERESIVAQFNQDKEALRAEIGTYLYVYRPQKVLCHVTFRASIAF